MWLLLKNYGNFQYVFSEKFTHVMAESFEIFWLNFLVLFLRAAHSEIHVLWTLQCTTTLYTILIACPPLILQPNLITASLRPSFMSPFGQLISLDYFRFWVNGILHPCWCDWPSLWANVLTMFLLWPMLLMTECHVLDTVGIGWSAQFSRLLFCGPIHFCALLWQLFPYATTLLAYQCYLPVAYSDSSTSL